MLGKDRKTGVAGAVAAVGWAGPAATVGTIVAGSWFADTLSLEGALRCSSTVSEVVRALWVSAVAFRGAEVGLPNENGRDAIGGSLDALELSLMGAVCNAM